MAKRRYSWGERRAYYIGVGMSMVGAGKDLAARRLSDSFGENMTDKEYLSYQNGLLAPNSKPDMFVRIKQASKARQAYARKHKK